MSWVLQRRAEIAAQIVEAERAVIDAAMGEHRGDMSFQHDLRNIKARNAAAEACARLRRLREDADEYAAMEATP